MNIPGPGGSLGECVVCGKSFIKEVVSGSKVLTGRVNWFEEVIAVHESCVPLITGRHWSDLPDGPLRRACEAAEKESV